LERTRHEGGGTRTVPGSFLYLVFRRPERIGQLYSSVRRPTRAWERRLRYLRYLAHWALGSYVTWVLVLSSFYVLTFLDLGSSRVQGFANALPFDVGSDHFAKHLAERSVVVTVALIATAYYMNIFSTITTRGL